MSIKTDLTTDQAGERKNITSKQTSTSQAKKESAHSKNIILDFCNPTGQTNKNQQHNFDLLQISKQHNHHAEEIPKPFTESTRGILIIPKPCTENT